MPIKTQIRICIIALFAFSCKEDGLVKFNGWWLIDSITHNGDSIVPNTISSGLFAVNIEFAGYSGYENLKFDKIGKVDLPGFNSERLTVNFNQFDNYIVLTSSDSIDISLQTSKDVFLDTFKIVPGKFDYEIILKSDKSIIKILEVERLQDRRIDNMVRKINSY